ncbi:MAG: TolB family protein, partial [Candidatus Krumholzibacteriota bacterium]
MALFLSLAVASNMAAINFSDVTWRTIETDHFQIHYHDGEEFSARQVALIAEAIYEPVTEFYDCRIPTVHINLMDISDEPGGAAYYYQDRINLDVADFEFNLRGTTNWLRNVTTHEFVHLVSMQKSMKFPKSIPSFYLQFINFERERRPDVITGYPNYEIYIPIAGTVMPNWFAEGMAQFQTDKARSDIWDSHRDMILRTAVVNGTLLSMDEMKVFGKNSLNAELLYNQGFSLTNFIARRYGRDKIKELADALSRAYRIGFDGACRDILGISEDRLYSLWKEDISSRYLKISRGIEREGQHGEVIAGEGFLNIYPLPDGNGGLYFLSNRGGDYSDMDLVHLNSSGELSVIAGDITSRFALSPNGRFLCYSRITDENEFDRDYNALFMYDLQEKKERKIPNTVRASNPVYSPDGVHIAAVVTRGCTEHVAVIEPSSGESRQLFVPEKGTQFYGLSWG